MSQTHPEEEPDEDEVAAAQEYVDGVEDDD